MQFDATFFVGGLTCLDFCNTYGHLHVPPEKDFFSEYASIIQWGQAAGILSTQDKFPSQIDDRLLTRLLDLRALIFRLFLPFARSEAPSAADLEAFNACLKDVSDHIEIVQSGGGYALMCSSDKPLEQIICAVVRSAADLLLSDRHERINQCEECGWLFYDTSRNHRRRWCDMKICGNRAKARRHYERVKANRE
ncbi:MAG: hypothetical protein EHM70_02285 [Chloroflexota bacterium]|nr:MAG: hypothetical protein EHM70_02285 [Chloroflexota bacterium]